MPPDLFMDVFGKHVDEFRVLLEDRVVGVFPEHENASQYVSVMTDAVRRSFSTIDRSPKYSPASKVPCLRPSCSVSNARAPLDQKGYLSKLISSS
ncbi:MAG: hypothetical protein IPP94_18315 [Ignavibacteria bacterium]|nr:hypothetical protein [Ignavibacteria bacterium]